MLGGWFQENISDEAFDGLSGGRAPGGEPAELAGYQGGPQPRPSALTGAEGGLLHLSDLRARPQDFDPATRDRLIAGALQPGHVAPRAQRVR